MTKSSRGHIIEEKSVIPRLIIWIFGLAGLVAVVSLSFLFFPELRQIVEQDELANDNRAWLTRAWTEQDRPAEEVATQVEILTDNGIQGVYIETNAWHGETGEFVDLPYTRHFIERFRNQSRSIDLYAWLRLDLAYLYDDASQAEVVRAARRAVRDFDLAGVNIHVRSVPDNSDDLINLLRAVRQSIGENAVLSVAVPPDRHPLDPDVPSSPVENESLTWSQGYKQRVVLNVDEMVLMGHASGLETTSDYEKWLAYQVETYAEIIQNMAIPMRFVVALPTYDAEPGYDPTVENVETAVRGVKDGIAQAGEAGAEVDGVGLYPWELTDLFELEAYWGGWVQRDK